MIIQFLILSSHNYSIHWLDSYNCYLYNSCFYQSKIWKKT